MADKIKLALAVLMLGAGIAGFYVLGDYAQWMRVLGLLVVAGLAVLITAQTAVGRLAFSFLKESRTEVRKVVWPTRKETMQTTMVVIVMVFVLGILLWLLDMLLMWAVQLVTG